MKIELTDKERTIAIAALMERVLDIRHMLENEPVSFIVEKQLRVIEDESLTLAYRLRKLEK